MRLAIGAALVAGAVATPAAHRSAHPDLATPLRRGLAAVLHLPEREVSVGEVRLGAPATLRIGPLSAGALQLSSLAVTLDPVAALSGHARVRRVEASDGSLGTSLRIGSLDASLDRGHGRVTVHGIEFERAGVPVAVAELGVELENGEVARLAFGGAELGRSDGTKRAGAAVVDALAGTAVRDPALSGGWRLRAARPGLVVTGRYQGDTLLARAELERLPLAALAVPAARLGVDLHQGRASGTVWLRSTTDELRARGQLQLADVAVDHRSVAARPVGPLELRLDGEVRRVPGMLTVEDLEVTLGPVAITVSARGATSGRFDANLWFASTGCAQLLSALPRSLIPALDGFTVDGRIAGRGQLSGDLGHLADLHLGVDLAVGCRVLGDPPLADLRTLARALSHPHAVDGTGRPRAFLLGPGNPAWRALDSLPVALQRTILVAEDGRFYQHHGFDLDTIRRALSADLGAGRFERGASTISQQLVKNLFLSGERTAARKLEEAVLTWRLEQLVSKRRILELYLNLVEMGPGIYGMSEAAERYFGKEPEELSLDEAAQLAALLPAPRRGMDAAWQRRYDALKLRMPSEKLVMPEPTAPPVKLTRR